MESAIIMDFSAVRRLINVYLLQKLRASARPVKQEKFVEEVYSQLKEKNYDYSRKSILLTWKYLLDNYQHYKQNYTDDDAQKTWTYFSMMDSCFDNFKSTAGKFNDTLTVYLIDFLRKYKSVVLSQGLTMDVLEAVEDDFQKLGNYEIDQKDIYSHWLSLKRTYRKQLSRNTKSNKRAYFDALKDFFEKDPEENPTISQNELDMAIESIAPTDDHTNTKQLILDHCDTKNNVSGEDMSKYHSFTANMRDVLIQCVKRKKQMIQDMNGELDEDTLTDTINELSIQGHNTTKSAICDEWNDLTCRYELIKNSEHPEQWPYFEGLNYIYDTNEMDEISADDIGNDAESENIMNFVKTTQEVSMNEVKIGEKLLHIYECNNKEFLEIKDILIERNLLREETNYLLNIFAEKFSKRKK